MVKLYKVYLVNCSEETEELYRTNIVAIDADLAEEQCYLAENPICDKGGKCRCYYRAELDQITSPLGILAEIQSKREELIRIKMSGFKGSELTDVIINRKTAELDELTKIYTNLGGEC